MYFWFTSCQFGKHTTWEFRSLTQTYVCFCQWKKNTGLEYTFFASWIHTVWACIYSGLFWFLYSRQSAVHDNWFMGQNGQGKTGSLKNNIVVSLDRFCRSNSLMHFMLLIRSGTVREGLVFKHLKDIRIVSPVFVPIQICQSYLQVQMMRQFVCGMPLPSSKFLICGTY